MLLFCAPVATAQQYKLSGTLDVADQHFHYSLVFNDSAGFIKGYSEYTLPNDIRHKATISGTLDTSGKCSFIETSVVCSHEMGQVHYMVSAYGYIRKEGKNIWLKATATPRYKSYGSDVSRSMDYGTLLLDADLSTARRFLAGAETAKANDADSTSLTIVKANPREVQQLGTVTSDVPLALKWSGLELNIAVYDDKEEDGDKVTLILNDEVLVRELILTKEGEVLEATLHPGQNVLVVHAENNGTLPPNTSRMVLSDDKRHYELQTLINAQKEVRIEIVVPE